MKKLIAASLCAALASGMVGCITVKGGSEPIDETPAQRTESTEEQASPDSCSSNIELSVQTLKNISFYAPSSWDFEETDGGSIYNEPNGKATMVIQAEDVSELYDTTYDLMKDADDVDDIDDYVSDFIVDLRANSFVEDGLSSDVEDMDINGNKARVSDFVSENVEGGLCVMLLGKTTLVTLTVGGNSDTASDEEFESLIDMFGEVASSVSLT